LNYINILYVYISASKVDIKIQSHNATQKKHYEQNPNTQREKNKYKKYVYTCTKS